MRTRAPKIYEQGKAVKQYVLAHYEGDRRIRRTFATMAEAEKAQREVEQRKTADVEKQTILSKKIGLQAEKLGPNDLLDAVKGLSILKRQATLEIAASFYAKHHPAGKKRTVTECVNDFLLAKSEGGRRLATVKAYRDKLNLFTRNMNGKLVNEITADVLEAWLRQRKVGTATRVSYLRHLGAFFSFAVKRGYMVVNPARQLDMPKLDRQRITYLTVAEIRSLLAAAEAHEADLVPYIALGAFAGLRPVEIHGENSGHGPIDWRDIDLAKRRITVRSEQDKNREGRNVSISENLRAWLMPYRRDSGPVCYSRARFESVVNKSKVNYSKDILRHSFGTYHWTQHRNEGETAIQMGDSIKTIKKHYVNTMVEQEDAAQFWQVVPVEADKQMLSIKTA